jgi:hypothetical protein
MNDKNDLSTNNGGTTLQFSTDFVALVISSVLNGCLLYLFTFDQGNGPRRPFFFLALAVQFCFFLIPLVLLRRRSTTWKMPSLFVVAILGIIFSLIFRKITGVYEDWRYISAHPEDFFDSVVILGTGSILAVIIFQNIVFLILAYSLRLLTSVLRGHFRRLG